MPRAVTAEIIQMKFCILNAWLDVVIYFKRHPHWYSDLGGAGGDKFSLFYWLLTLRIALPRIRVISAIIGVTGCTIGTAITNLLMFV